jgi:hypothetical protein
LTSDQGVAGSSPARCAILETVSLRALHTLSENKQAVMMSRRDGFFVCQKAASDHLTTNRCDHLTHRAWNHLPHLTSPLVCLLVKKEGENIEWKRSVPEGSVAKSAVI